MKVLDPGHKYELSSLDGDAPQTLTFVKREGEGYPGNVGHYPGTTSQEVLRCLIDRAFYVNNQISCWQTWLGARFAGVIVWLFEHRAAKRHKRKAPGFYAATFGATCNKCGHVGCEGPCHDVRGEREGNKELS